MKKVYIVHGWGGSPISEPWFNWLIEELERKRYFVDIFDMPNTDNPKIEEWVKFLEKKVKHPDKDTFFVGHSIGCQTILRYLEKLHKGLQIGGCAFVAPWFDLINQEPEELEIANPWTTTKIDFSRIL